MIIFDVDSKDLTLGMSCPAPSFVEEDLLIVARELLSSQGGCGSQVGVAHTVGVAPHKLNNTELL